MMEEYYELWKKLLKGQRIYRKNQQINLSGVPEGIVNGIS